MPSRVKSPSADLGIRTGNSEIFLIKKKKSSDQSDVFAHTETVPGGGGVGGRQIGH